MATSRSPSLSLLSIRSGRSPASPPKFPRTDSSICRSYAKCGSDKTDKEIGADTRQGDRLGDGKIEGELNLPVDVLRST